MRYRYERRPGWHWYEAPLLCLLGLHQFQPHPSGCGWEVCKRCWTERVAA
jgi:hypothetical protein